MEAKILLTLTFLVGSLFSHPLPSAQLQGSGPSAAIFTSRATGAVGSSYGIQPSLTSKGFTFPSSSLNSVSKPSCPTTRYWNRRFRRYQSYKRCQSWCQCWGWWENKKIQNLNNKTLTSARLFMVFSISNHNQMVLNNEISQSLIISS